MVSETSARQSPCDVCSTRRCYRSGQAGGRFIRSRREYQADGEDRSQRCFQRAPLNRTHNPVFYPATRTTAWFNRAAARNGVRHPLLVNGYCLKSARERSVGDLARMALVGRLREFDIGPGSASRTIPANYCIHRLNPPLDSSRLVSLPRCRPILFRVRRTIIRLIKN